VSYNFPAAGLLQEIQHRFVSLGDTLPLASQKALALVSAAVQREGAARGFSDCFVVATWICVLGIITGFFLPLRSGAKGGLAPASVQSDLAAEEPASR